jgi:hypothetical protein
MALIMGSVTLSLGCGTKGTPAPEKSKTIQKKEVKKGSGNMKNIGKSTSSKRTLNK